MILLPATAVCEYCGWHYSVVCRCDDGIIYVQEHVDECGRASQLAMAATSKVVDPKGFEGSTPSSSAKTI